MGRLLPFGLYSKGNINNNIIYSNTSISTKWADIFLSNACTRIPSGYSNASYRIRLLKLTWLKAITGKRYLRLADIKGNVSWDGKIHISGTHLDIGRGIINAFWGGSSISPDSIFKGVSCGTSRTFRKGKNSLKHFWDRVF